ncbi:FAD/NAD(P)-binding protein [Pantoea agglomerans]|jgi:hypothetical protein|uniref:FAD/NAD(P)-binding protein n=1 Tax=Enterobacter agglomerans TaxID=549 RepID=UPI00320B82AF
MTKIAIVGSGALGTYAMERLAALAWHEVIDASSMEIMLFERTGRFGDGEVYDIHQPATNRLNTAAGELALGADSTIEKAKSWLLPEWNTSFYHWCRRQYELTGHACYDLDASDAAGRAVYGEALRAALQYYIEIIRRKGGTVCLIPAEVTAIEPIGNLRFSLSAELNGQPRLFCANEVLLVTGHARRAATSGKNNRYLANPYPVSHTCASSVVPPSSQVGIRGMGLTAIDLILALTEGRGGHFTSDNTSPRRTALHYSPNGNEPDRIVVSSRCGLFTRARSWLGTGNTRLRTSPWFLTREAIDQLRDVAGNTTASRKIDAKRTLMPLIVLEMAALFHAAAAGDVTTCPFPEQGKVSQLYQEFLQGASVEIGTITALANAEAFSGMLFNPEEFFAPLVSISDKNIDSTEALIRFIEFDNSQALPGAVRSPYKAAAEGVWRDLRSVFSYATDNGGLTPESHQYFVEKLYRYHNHLSNGASLSSMEKILALLRAGIVDASVSQNPVWTYNDNRQQWLATSAAGLVRQVDVLFEANIPSIGDARYDSRLHKQLFQSGFLQRFVNQLGTETYISGGVATDGDFHPVGCANPWRKAVTVLGAQLDGAVFFQPSAAKLNGNDSNLNKVAAWANGVAERAKVKSEAKL